MILSIVVASTGMALSTSLQRGQKLDESIWPKLCNLVPKVSNRSRGVASDVEMLISGVCNTTGVPKKLMFQEIYN